ncbi:phosphatase PAP2 family protein [Segetibacter aerophilus]|uniref:phosphatase PAP2 family protein n=1 Tax=Segetibacter aerophilus TaxID=670293 RepID=UPI0011BF9F3F|nr:phosphatase PAP2 family protein [Segetibacter aerophilus]
MKTEDNILIARKNSLKNRWLLPSAAVIIFLIPYTVVNNLTLQRNTISFIPGEQSIPFLPWTFIIYLSAFLQSLFVMYHLPRPLLYKTLLSLSIAVMIGFILFLIIPLQYPRELYVNNNPLVILFRKIDRSGNCFPSLHIVITTVFSYTYCNYEKSKLKGFLMWLWCAMIIVSVLTTKQHYLIDVLGGIALAIPTLLHIRKQNFLSVVTENS